MNNPFYYDPKISKEMPEVRDIVTNWFEAIFDKKENNNKKDKNSEKDNKGKKGQSAKNSNIFKTQDYQRFTIKAKNHAAKNGAENTVRLMQRNLNLLQEEHPAKQAKTQKRPPLKEDGLFGQKTKTRFLDALGQFGPSILS